MENVFLGVRSSDESVRRQATDALMEQMECPAFLWSVLEFLDGIDKGNGPLVDTVVIAILQMVRLRWSGQTYAIENLNVFVERIIQLIFSLPFGNRANVLEIIDNLMMDRSIDFSGMISACFSVIQKGDLSEDVATAINILCSYVFFKTSRRIETVDQFEELSRAILVCLVPIMSQITEIIKNSEVLSEHLCSAARSSSSILKIFVMKSKSVFVMPEMKQLFQCLVLILQAKGPEQTVLKMKKTILDDLRVCASVLAPPEFRQPHMTEVAFFFCEHVAPILWQFVVSCFRDGQAALLCVPLLFLVLSFLTKNVCVGQILVPDFIDYILIPCCRLSREDAETFVEIPEQFLEFCYYLDRHFIETPRILVACIIDEIGANKNLSPALEMVMERAMTSSSDTEEFESRLFLLSCIARHRPLDMNLGSLALGIIQEGKSPFLIATAVVLLTNLKIEPKECSHISLSLLTGCNVPTIQLLSIYLFQRSFSQENTIISFPLPEVIKAVMELADKVTDAKPTEMLDLLIRQFSDDFVPIAQEIVHVSLNMWLKYVQMEDELSASNLLNSANRIIDSLPMDSEPLFGMSGFVIELCCLSIVTGKCTMSEALLLHVLSSLASRMTNPPLIMFQTIPEFLKYFRESTEVALTLTDAFCTFFGVLISKPGFCTLENGSFANSLCEICEVWLQDRSRIDVLRNAFALIALLIQVGGPPYIGYVHTAIGMIKDLGRRTSLLPSLFTVVVSGMFVDLQTSLSSCDQDLTNVILSHVDTLTAVPVNYMRLFFVGLCILAKSGVKQAYFAATVVARAIVNREAAEDSEWCEDETILELSRDTPEIDMPMLEFPFEKDIDVKNSFKETSEVTGLFQELPPDVQEFMNTSFVEY